MAPIQDTDLFLLQRGAVHHKTTSEDIQQYIAGNLIAVQDTAPTNPQLNTLWYNTLTGKLSIYYDDGDSEQWVSVT